MKNFFAETILLNGGFETGKLEPWTRYGPGDAIVTDAEAWGGKYSLRIIAETTEFIRITQGNFFCYGGMPILVSFWVKPVSGDGWFQTVWDWRTIEGRKFDETYIQETLGPGWNGKQHVVYAPDCSQTFSLTFRAIAKATPKVSFALDSVFIPALLSPKIDTDLVLLTRVVT